jgi:hypothetical protein
MEGTSHWRDLSDEGATASEEATTLVGKVRPARKMRLVRLKVVVEGATQVLEEGATQVIEEGATTRSSTREEGATQRGEGQPCKGTVSARRAYW